MKPLLLLLTAFVASAHGKASILNADSLDAVPDSYIVVLKPAVSGEALTSHLSWADGVLHPRSAARKSTFDFGAFKGYHLQASKAVAALLAESDEV
jgi:hypothetical protein